MVPEEYVSKAHCQTDLLDNIVGGSPVLQQGSRLLAIKIYTISEGVVIYNQVLRIL